MNSISVDIENILHFDDINLNKVTLLTGMNGTGKTMVLKCVWIMNLLASTYSKSDLKNTQLFSQFVLDNSFDNQTFSGSIIAKWSTLVLALRFTDGNVEAFEAEVLGKAEYEFPIFMSKEMRLFSDITSYLKIKEELKVDINTEEGLIKITKFYKIYDVFLVERLLNRLPYKLTSQETGSLKEDLKKEIKSLSLQGTQIMYTDEKGTFSTLTLSAGEQSLLNLKTTK